MGTEDGLKALFTIGLPVSREERFYTATVLPALISRSRFAGFEIFRDAVISAAFASGVDAHGLVGFEANPLGPETNVQFLTEFDLWKSLSDPGVKARFPDAPAIRAVPDLVVFIEGSKPVLLVIEAKMFLYFTANQLSGQMHDQQLLMEYVASRLSSASGVRPTLIQMALLPDGRLTGKAFQGFPYPIITWETLCKAYAANDENHYWVRMLDLALSRWNDLASKPSSFGENADDKWPGQQIIDSAQAGRLVYASVGRRGGLKGKEFTADVATGAWKTQKYELALDPALANAANWFTVDEFVAAVS